MKESVIKTLKRYSIVGFFGVLILGGLIYRGINGPATASSSTSSDSGEHKCGLCNASFSGNGWSTVGGEQFEQTSWSGYGYCSKKCAYDSQPARWKR
ncbi:MAG: hypothetical protein JWO09_141 [Bacteroidetes bacterium]|nr:hypothetical protein [Bacteroidota bacterium]